ncbi:unnamed protein product [Chrysoparadoxa australica]
MLLDPSGRSITPASVFTAVSLLNMLIFPMNAFPWVLSGLVEARVSFKRLKPLLLSGEGGNLRTTLSSSPRSGSHLQEEEEPLYKGLSLRCWWERAVSPPASEGSKAAEYQRKMPVMEFEHLEHQLDSESLTTRLLVEVDEPQVPSTEGAPTPPSPACVVDGVSLAVQAGELVAIVGERGAGKSTLLQGLLGEVFTSWTSSSTCMKGPQQQLLGSAPVAYCPQVPWIRSGTIRSNILFGNCWDPELYSQVLDATALTEDLEAMASDGGDLREVAAQGNTLSGGQRQRIALARAAYSQHSLYVLDDVLSALDEGTQRHVMKKCICGIMARGGQSTVILVTSSVQLLKGFRCLMLEGKGSLLTEVPWDKLAQQSMKPGSSASGNGLSPRTRESYPDAADDCDGFIEESTGCEGAGRDLTTAEHRREGTLERRICILYAKEWGVLGVLTIVSLVVAQATSTAFSFWLSYWSTHADVINPKRFLAISSIIAGIGTVATLGRAFFFVFGGLKSARSIHDRCLSQLLGADICGFFDVTPTGCVLNRLGQDVGHCDDSLPFHLNILLAQSAGLAATLAVLLYAAPSITLLIIPAALFYAWLGSRYRTISRELKRLDSVLRSPVVAALTEDFDGGPTIRAHGHVLEKLKEFIECLELSLRASFTSSAAGVWLGVRLQAVGLLLAVFTATEAVISCGLARSCNPGLLGLSLSYALPVVASLQGFMASFTDTEKEMISVERLDEFSSNHHVPQEEEKLMGVAAKPKLSPLLSGWPHAGTVKIEDASLTYRKGLPPSLQAINVHIPAGQKVALMGRTGSGKTSFFRMLLRMAPCAGTVTVDGIDTKSISLQSLRSSLAVVSQEPLVFKGSVRYNLDPLGNTSDAVMNDALRRCCLEDISLDMALMTGGRNLSVGTRQLLCLARVVIHKSALVLVDEPVSGLDSHAQSVISRVMREEFSGSTLIVIAHGRCTGLV